MISFTNLNLTMIDRSNNNRADEYNRVKAIVFSTYHNKGIETTLEYLEGYNRRKTIDYKDYIGLKAEINFYHRYRKELTLDPVWDYGIKCDFVGNINDCSNVRLDITTNLTFKDDTTLFNLQVGSGRIYKYVKVNPGNGIIDTIVDYFNSSAEKALNRYNLAVFMPGDRDKYNPYIEVYSLDINNPYDGARHVDTITDFYLPTINEVLAELPDEMEQYEVSYEVDKYCATIAKLFNYHYGIRVDAFGQYDNYLWDLDSKYIKIFWRHPALKDYIDDTYENDLEDVY